MVSRSHWRVAESCTEGYLIFEPSDRCVLMSLMLKIKRSWPKTVPWGTPEVTGDGVEDLALYLLVNCVVRLWNVGL